MSDETIPSEDISQRLAAAELQVERSKVALERSKVVMESLAGFCHALGQPATVLLSSIELLKMQSAAVDAEMQKQILDICYDAVIEIRDLLAQMKKKREYVAEAYLPGNEKAGNMISIQEWHDKTPPPSDGQ